MAQVVGFLPPYGRPGLSSCFLSCWLLWAFEEQTWGWKLPLSLSAINYLKKSMLSNRLTNYFSEMI